MNIIELSHALRQLRLGGMAAVLETRLHQAQAEAMAPIDLISCLVSDELSRRSDRLLERRRKQAGFRDPQKRLDNFDFNFNPKMNRSLIFDLATSAFIGRREDSLFLGPPGSGKSHLAQAIGQAAIQQGYRVLYREAHTLLDELADATLDGTRKEYIEWLVSMPLLIRNSFPNNYLRPACGKCNDSSCAREARKRHPLRLASIRTRTIRFEERPSRNKHCQDYKNTRHRVRGRGQFLQTAHVLFVTAS